MDTAWKAGLEDVIATRSAICQVDGAAGTLYYRGYEIGELAGTIPFEDVTALLWDGELPSPAASAQFGSRLEAARGLPAAVADLLRTLPRDSHPLDALRTAVSLAATRGLDVRLSDRDAQGATARWRQRGRPGDAARDRRSRARRELCRGAPRGAGRAVQARARRSARPRARVRSSRLPRGRRAGAGAPGDGEVDGRSDRPAKALRGRRARLRRDARPHAAAGERRLLLGRGLRRARDPAGFLHVDLRGRARRGLVCARAGAVRRQPAHQTARRVRRRRAAVPRGRSAAQDRDLHSVVVEVVGATVVATAGPHVLEVGGDVAAEVARVVGDDDGAGDELRLELAEIVEVVLLGGIDEGEIEAARQERDHAQRVARDHLHAPVQARLGNVRPHEAGQEGIRLDTGEPAAGRHRAGDQDRRVTDQRTELDRARGPVAVEEPAQDSALAPADDGDVPARRGAVHAREHPARLLGHARAADTRDATVSGTG